MKWLHITRSTCDNIEKSIKVASYSVVGHPFYLIKVIILSPTRLANDGGLNYNFYD